MALNERSRILTEAPEKLHEKGHDGDVGILGALVHRRRRGCGARHSAGVAAAQLLLSKRRHHCYIEDAPPRNFGCPHESVKAGPRQSLGGIRQDALRICRAALRDRVSANLLVDVVSLL